MRAGGPIAVVGAGAFGTALSVVLARNGSPVRLYGRDKRQIEEIRERRQNPRYLPDVDIPGTVDAVSDPATLTDAPTVLLAVPSQAQREAARALAASLAAAAAIVICAKGFEKTSGKRLSEVIAEELPGPRTVAVLSGPGFAADIAGGLPTAMTLAASELVQAERLVALLSGSTFRLYASADMTGVEIGGALKNVLAIASGIVEGAKLGESARAALIARGLAELSRFAVTAGAEPLTLAGLSGLGDLVLTATSHQSRNFRFGVALGEGKSAADLAGENAMLAEGAHTAAVAAALARQHGIAMPITDAVSEIIGGRLSVAEALKALMERPLKTEGH
jgi:glycerol-3-phosphate dehydrogenase (NAD(P)+)